MIAGARLRRGATRATPRLVAPRSDVPEPRERRPLSLEGALYVVLALLLSLAASTPCAHPLPDVFSGPPRAVLDGRLEAGLAFALPTGGDQRPQRTLDETHAWSRLAEAAGALPPPRCVTRAGLPRVPSHPCRPWGDQSLARAPPRHV